MGYIGLQHCLKVQIGNTNRHNFSTSRIRTILAQINVKNHKLSGDENFEIAHIDCLDYFLIRVVPVNY